MKITADTNILLRAAVQDDPAQTKVAAHILRTSELVAIPISALCEFVWVMRRAYKRPNSDVAHSIRALIGSDNVVANRPVIEAGLRMLDAGGDFADGAIAYEGEWLGAEEFVSFDREAVTMLKAQGKRAKLLA